MSTGPIRIDLAFAAPVPRGHEVGWVRLRHDEAERVGEIVFDVTSGLLYCRSEMQSLFQHALVGTNPLHVALAHGWHITEQVMGRAAGASVATATESMATCLFVDATTAAPYR